MMDIRQGPSDIHIGSFKPGAADDDIHQGPSDIQGIPTLDPLFPSAELYPSMTLHPNG